MPASDPAGAALRCAVERRPATAEELAAAWRRLDGDPGMYFGCDAGIAGMHPAEALLVVDPSLLLRVFADGVEAEARDAFGEALLAHPRVAAWRAGAERRPGRSAVAALRDFLPLFDAGEGPPADAILAGALRFEAHRLGRAAEAIGVAADADAAGDVFGTFFFSAVTWQRDSGGTWERVSLTFADPSLARAAGAGPRAVAAVPPSPPAAALAAARPPTSAAEVPPRNVRSAVVAPSPLSPPRDDFPLGGYARVVARALDAMAGAGLVSLTLSQSFRRRLGERTPAQAFARLRQVNPAPATFLVDGGDGEVVFGASPDLQLLVSGADVDAFPVCGTVARGHGPVGESEALRSLFDEEVDAASLAVCTDALRNDLAPLCVPGSLRLVERRRPMTLATVVHAVDRLQGTLRAGADAWDAIVATAAPVMVTGTPREAALAAIAAHEAGSRGWYGGLVVELRGDGAARVGTILRAATVRDGVAEVRTGGDLVAGSDPAREELESRIKAVSLWRALGLAVDADLEARVAGGSTPWSTCDIDLPAAVALHADGDPFAAAVAEALGGLGLELDAAAAPRVLVGGDDAAARAMAAGGRGLVAIGDAAARVLRAAGHAVVAIAPQHGRLVGCHAVAGTPSAAMRPFTAMRYATLALSGNGSGSGADGDTWSPWLHDDEGRPLVLARAAPPTVCFLIRPESLLSDPLALELLRAAVAFAAGRGLSVN